MSAVAKISHIRNPLTIIAMFAVIAEVSGTIVLPLLDVQVQRVYVWFLMVFPTALVLLFFYTLHTKRDALYGPGDYNDESNFMYLARPASKAELAIKTLTEIDVVAGAEAEQNRAQATDENQAGEPAARELTTNGPSPEKPAAQAQDELNVALGNLISRVTFSANDTASITKALYLRRFDRDRALKSLESTYGPIRVDMMVMGEVVDGLAGSQEHPVLIETMHISAATNSSKVSQEISTFLKTAEKLKADRATTVTAVLLLIAERRFLKQAEERADSFTVLAANVWPEIKTDARIFLVEDRTEPT